MGRPHSLAYTCTRLCCRLTHSPRWFHKDSGILYQVFLFYKFLPGSMGQHYSAQTGHQCNHRDTYRWPGFLGGKEDMKHSRGRNRGGVETWTSSIEPRINHDCVEADRTWATTPLAAGICSARVDGARIGSAACVRIALIPSRAGAHLFQKVNSLFQHDFSPLYCRLTYSPRWCHRGMGNRGQKGPRELLGPGAWAGLGVGLVVGVGSH